MWMNLWNAHPGAEYVSVGKTYDGNDIWLFTVGNRAGAKILWDGEMHGGEDKGSEALFLIANWLLESGSKRAAEILEHNYIMFIPIINDQNTRGNGNTQVSINGVDLNRNFKAGWDYVSPGADIYWYAGDSAISEPETIVMRNVFSTYKPVVYVNMHSGTGPYAAYYRGADVDFSERLVNKTKDLCSQLGITPYPTRIFGSKGYAIGDAGNLGVKSAWIIECVGSATGGLHRVEDYEELQMKYFPKCLALFISGCELSSSVNPISPFPCILTVQQRTNESTQIRSSDIISVKVNATFAGDFSSVANVRIEYPINVGINAQIELIKSNYNIWSGEIPNLPASKTTPFKVMALNSDGEIIESVTRYYINSIPVLAEMP